MLSPKEGKIIQSLAGAMKTTAPAPGEFVKQYYDLLIDVQKLKVAIIQPDRSLIRKFDDVISQQRQEDSLIEGFNAGYAVLADYADLLLALTDDTNTKTLKRQDDAFIASFDTAVVKYNSFTSGTKLPASSLGGLVSKIVVEVGTRRIRYLQRKYLLDLVTQADSVIQPLCDNYIIIDHTRDSTAINIDRADLRNTFLSFLISIGDDTVSASAYNRYVNYDPVYYNWINKLDALKALDQSNTAAFKKIKTSHTELLNALKDKTTFVALLGSVKDLYGSINGINESYKQLQKDLTPNK